MFTKNCTADISIEAIRERLSPLLMEEGLQFILLFGSHASEKTHKQSDIDVAVLFDRPVDVLALTNKVIKLLHTSNVDVVDLSRASPLLKFSAAKNGTLIYEREVGVFNHFYSLAFRIYADTKMLREAQKPVISSFLTARGLA